MEESEPPKDWADPNIEGAQWGSKDDAYRYWDTDSTLYYSRATVLQLFDTFYYGRQFNYKIPRGPKVRFDYVVRSFGVFKTISGFSIDMTF